MPTSSGHATELEAWEVFQQQKDGDPMRHGGNVMAPDAELAMHYAREMFGRRQESTRLWPGGISPRWRRWIILTSLAP